MGDINIKPTVLGEVTFSETGIDGVTDAESYAKYQQSKGAQPILGRNSQNSSAFQTKKNADGSVTVYQYLKAGTAFLPGLSGDPALGGLSATVLKWTGPNANLKAQTYLEKHYADEAERINGFLNSGVIIGANTAEGKALASNAASGIAGKSAVFEDGTDSLGEKNQKQWEAHQARMEEEKKAYEEMFQDKLGGFGAQNFFMENIRQFVMYAVGQRERGYSETFDKNSGLKLLSVKNPESLMHFLQNKKAKLRAFQSATPEMYSALVPQVRLFFVYQDGTEAEIPFSMYTESLNSTDATSALKNRDSRGDDVGLLGFEWNYDGGKVGNAFLGTGGGVGTANLSLFFQSAGSVTKRRSILGSSSTGKSKQRHRKFSYDMLLSRNIIDHNNNEIVDFKNGRIRAIVKYGVNENMSKSISNSKAFLGAAKDMAVALNLDPAQYELEFDETGGLTLNIEYRLTIENTIKDPKLNIFSTGTTSSLELLKRDIEREKATHQEIKNDLDDEQLKDIEKSSKEGDLKDSSDLIEEMESGFFVAQNEIYGSMKEKILSKGYKITMNRGDIMNYLTLRQTPKSARSGLLSDAERSAGAQYLWNSTSEVTLSKMEFSDYEGGFSDAPAGAFKLEDEGNIEMHWIFLGDIFEAVLSQPNIKKIMEDENMVFILGQIIIAETLQGYDGVDPVKPVAVNIADIPISLDVWNQFFSNHIVKRKIVNLDLFGFVRLMIQNLINPLLNNPDRLGMNDVPRSNSVSPLFYSGKASRVKAMFKGTNRKFFPDIRDVYLGQPDTPNPLSKGKKSNIFLLAGNYNAGLLGSLDKTRSWTGDEKVDEDFGIQHYYLARDRGLLKTATFTKQGVPRSREILVAGSMDTSTNSRPQTAFWEPFNVNMELFGDPNIRFGGIIFLQPTLPGITSFLNPESPAYKLQIGGYHRVMEINNRIDPSGWDTSIVAMREDPISGKLANKKLKSRTEKIYPNDILS
jgi:hypothetical protein